MNRLRLWTKPSYVKYRIWRVVDDLYDMFSEDCYYCDGKLHIWGDKARWKYQLLSVVFTENYWLRREYENCPWQEQMEEYGEPYYSRF